MLNLVIRSLRFYWRTHLGVCAGTLLASAVLTGALLVGDSVDYSLQSFAKMRLGDIHFAANTQDQFIEESFATRLAEQTQTKTAAALHLRGMAIHQGVRSEDRVQINQVEVIGVDAGFWGFSEGAAIDLAANETAINAKLATALGVNVGDEISLRVAKPSLMSRDAPLSWRNEDESRRGVYKIRQVLADDELGRFSLSPSQIAPYNAFVNRRWLQEQVDLSARVNLILVGGGVSAGELEAAVKAVWTPEDIGLELRVHESGVVQLESARIFLNEETVRAAHTVPDAQGTLTYLVSAISHGEKSTPYSFMVGGPVPSGMRDDELVINRWLADEIGASPGDTVTVDYAVLLPTNEFDEATREFRVHSIREMPDLQTEEDLMPTFPGLSDVQSCSDWDVGMPTDEALLLDEANEAYWDAYHQTPKALITLAASQDMWENRFGKLTAVRYPGDEETASRVRSALMAEMDPSLAGLFFLPVLQQGEDAVSQAMDFGGLFLGMSFFLIGAALMLTGLLFVFGVQQRASEMGTLLALGFKRNNLRTFVLGEGVVIALIGATGGAALGAFYTRALIYGLGQYWQGAVANAAIEYHATTQTLVMGASISFACAMGAMAVAMWRQSRQPARVLLSMDFTQEQVQGHGEKRGRTVLALSVFGILLAIAIIVFTQVVEVGEVMIPFFGAGSLLLISGLGLCRHALVVLNTSGRAKTLTLGRLALQNIARRQGRSLVVVASLACGCFLVFAVSAMQEDLQAHAHHRSSGTGGFSLLAESTFPILEDPLVSLGIADVSGAAIKVRDGDDASCLNLNHAQTPRLLGVNVEDMVARGAFSSESDAGAIWKLLNLELEGGAIPALIGDSNTAMWTLKKKAGVENGDVLIYRGESGDEIDLKLVGALPMRLSVFQGTLLISKENFTRLYPSEAGHRMFLIDTPKGLEGDVAVGLRKRFARFGLDAIPAVQRLLEFYSVESAYLAMFLVLGGLGLAIGSVGMGIVVLRNLFERRGETAMLRALGFERLHIYGIFFTEYGSLLIAGLAIGGVAATVSMAPALFAPDSAVDFGVQFRLAFLVFLASVTCMLLAIFMASRNIEPSVLRRE